MPDLALKFRDAEERLQRITKHHSAPERTLREQSLNAFLIRANSLHMHTNMYLSFPCLRFLQSLPIHCHILLFLICFSDCLTPCIQHHCGCVGLCCLLLCNQRVFMVVCGHLVCVCVRVCDRVLPCIRGYLCVCVAAAYCSGLRRRQPSTSTYYITHTHTYTHKGV